MKNVIQRNLDLKQIYQFVSAFYSPILEGGGHTCDNCGKPISNIAKLLNETGTMFFVGMDCAETLTMKETWGFQYQAKPAFQKAKSIRQKFLNGKKKYGETFAGYLYACKDGQMMLNYYCVRNSMNLPMGWETFDSDTWTNFIFPAVKEFLTDTPEGW